MNIVQKQKIDQPKKISPKTVVALIVGIIVFLGLAQIIVANRLATQGELLRQYQIETERIIEESQRIENEIVKLSSLSHIASQSARLGLMKSPRVVYLPGSLPIAQERR